MYDSCLGWKQLSQISKTLRTYCFHWNSWLLSQQHVPEVKSSTHHFGKKKRMRYLQLLRCSSSGLFWSCQWGSYQLWFSMALPGNMVLPFDLCPWPVWSLSSLHVAWVPTDLCSGCASCSYHWRGLAFLSMTSTIFHLLPSSEIPASALLFHAALLYSQSQTLASDCGLCSDVASREVVQN